MPQTAKKIQELTPQPQENSPDEAPQPQKKSWARLEGESMLWFNRFKRYRSLGAKRSLRAAFEQERSQIKALKSTKDSEKPAELNTAFLHEVPKLPHVPGSWKQASVQFNWVERARAYDEWIIDTTTTEHINDIMQGAAVGIERIKILKELYRAMLAQYTTNHNLMSYEQEFACIQRMQSILRDIREEMAGYDESIARLLTKRTMRTVYESATPEELKAHKIVRKAK